MEQREKTRKLLKDHYQTYPKLQIEDVFKFLYQSVFGCEHFVSSIEKATEMILTEHGEMNREVPAEIETLDGAYCRVPLTKMDAGLTADTFGKLFVSSSKRVGGSVTDLKEKLNIVLELVREGALPFSENDFNIAACRWESEGYPSIHHSDTFRESYHPSYRVISKEYIPFLPLFSELDRRLAHGRVFLAVDGGSASGKTTLAGFLEELYGCTVFHMDDFFLRPEQRTPERFAEVGGNVDRERFLEEVLCPLSQGGSVTYRKFDCGTMSLADKVEVVPERLVVIEGAYSMHPELEGYYDFSVFLDVSPELQRERILRRNSYDMAKRFFNEWIPLERTYFEATHIKERCSMTVCISEK